MLAAIGPLSLDVVAGGAPRPGGTVFYSARALASLRAEARVGASCAAGDRPLLAPALEAFGLPVAWYESSSTTSYRFHYDGDSRVMWQEAVGDPWTPSQAVEAAGAAEWVHVGQLVRTDFDAETLRALSDGRQLLVDAQGLVRTPALGRLRKDAEIGDVLRHVSILKLTDDEAETLSGTADPQALRSLGVPEIVLTLGSRGSVVITDRLAEHVHADSSLGEVDPTGAGDMFAAAYLEARARGAEPVEAAVAANGVVATLLGETGRL